MSHINLSTQITAPTARVWRALCDPEEVGSWDSGVDRALDAPEDYPKPGQHVRWRCRSGLWRILHDRPQQVVPEQTLHSLLSLGIVRYDETYTLSSDDDGTLLTVSLDVSVPIPILGALIVRWRAHQDARSAFGASLANLKCWCEAGS